SSTEFNILSLHEALPICLPRVLVGGRRHPALVPTRVVGGGGVLAASLRPAARLAPSLRQVPRRSAAHAAARHRSRLRGRRSARRSEEHTSELQSRENLVC